MEKKICIYKPKAAFHTDRTGKEITSLMFSRMIAFASPTGNCEEIERTMTMDEFISEFNLNENSILATLLLNDYKIVENFYDFDNLYDQYNCMQKTFAMKGDYKSEIVECPGDFWTMGLDCKFLTEHPDFHYA